MTKSLHFYVTAVISLVCGVCCADAQQCKSVHSTYGMMLRGFVFQESNTANMMTCGQLCNANIRCQSINYVISRNLCELNNRTKEARPDNYVQDTDRIYVTRPSERVPLGSIQELPAESCSEIKASEGDSVVSGKYWLDSIKPGQAVSVPCDMLTGDPDECNASVPVCDVNAICQNTLASFNCTCKTGYTGNGLNCQECPTYRILSNAIRKVTSRRNLASRYCDRSLGPAWFRFQGDAGTKMPTSCVPPVRCGTDITGWLNGAHPKAYEGKVTRQVCFHWRQNCCFFWGNIQVQNCNGYYLYYFNGAASGSSCYFGYCSTD